MDAVSSGPAEVAVRTSEGEGGGIVPESRTCSVCQRQRAKYRCPRCFIAYCSVPCYSKHGGACTEAFYRECVTAELALRETEDNEAADGSVARLVRDGLVAPGASGVTGGSQSLRAAAVGAAVRRAEAAAPLESTGAGELDMASPQHTREFAVVDDEVLAKVVDDMIAGGAEGRLPVLDDLPPEARKVFLREVASGRISREVGSWMPWWATSMDSHLAARSPAVAECSADGVVSNDAKEGLPPCHVADNERPVDLETLSTKPPSPELPAHLVNMIYAYVYVLRLHCGSWADSVAEAVDAIMQISAVLQDSAAPVTIAESLMLAVEASHSPATKTSTSFASAAVGDVAQVFASEHFVQDALYDLWCMLSAGQRELPAKTKGEGAPARKYRRKLVAAIRKLSYFRSWTDSEWFVGKPRQDTQHAVLLFAAEVAATRG